jgi:hypothetical protein
VIPAFWENARLPRAGSPIPATTKFDSRKKIIRHGRVALRFILRERDPQRVAAHNFAAMENPSSTVPASVANAPHPTASGRVPLSPRAAALALVIAVAVPIVFFLVLVTVLVSSNYNLLDWME